MAKTRELAVVELFGAAARTATANGTGADLRSYTNTQGHEHAAHLNVGAASGTTPTLDVKLQESDDNATFTDITGATFAQRAAAGNETIHFRTRKRYVRAVATIGGGTPSFTFAVVALATKRLV